MIDLSPPSLTISYISIDSNRVHSVAASRRLAVRPHAADHCVQR